MNPRAPTFLIVMSIAALAAAGCGSSGNDNAATTAATTAATETPTTTATSAPEVTSGKLTIKMDEFSFTPKDVTVTAGKLVIDAPNVGKVEHELVLLRTDQDPGSFTAKNGRIDEDAPGLGHPGEIEETAPGETGTHTFNLKPGKYAMVCNISGHYEGGMWGSLTAK